MTDVFEVLTIDHQQVKLVLTELGAAAGDLEKLAERLVVEESRHEAAEETYFWPAVREKLPNGDELADTALHQEQEGKEVLDALRKATPGDPDFLRLVDTFTSAGQEHIAFEELQVWPALRTVLSSDGAGELGSKIEMAKKTGPTRPHPGGPDSPGGLKSAGVAAAAVDKVRDAVGGRG
jgi:Hemerythrin HHE cation binding domain